jgi:soluble lytic murein transglycosylase-like protein
LQIALYFVPIFGIFIGTFGCVGTAQATTPVASVPDAQDLLKQQAALAALPHILSAPDLSRYAAIFALQAESNWSAARAEMEALDDKLLVGTALAQRYLSPAYKTEFAEAKDWLAKYTDLPDARAIWLLAKRKEPSRSLAQPAGASAADGEASTPSGKAEAALPAEPDADLLRRPASFQAGLAAWRGKRWSEAARLFEAAAGNSHTSSWYVAASAYWAARAHLMRGDTKDVDRWFETAAEQPRTFYGFLARDTLGIDPILSKHTGALSAEDVHLLEAQPGGRRALALMQIGEHDRAEAELRTLSVGGNRDLANAIVALADRVNMPDLCLALGNRSTQVAARYPVPGWKPQHGFSVDRALMFALMMQESRFDAHVHNGSGASGLMQLMPATAVSVARSAGISLRNVSDLVDPVLNLSIGQAYVRELIGHQQVNGNLILLLAAYNGGTGSLSKWQAEAERDDPLLFIESLPSQETRLYVQRVLTTLWIYRVRFGQALPDLDALAANQWPTYVALDKPPEQLVLRDAVAR